MKYLVKSKTITRGFILAGLMNLSVLIFSRFFTNSTIPEVDPDVMSNFGLVMIALWGLAYMAVAKHWFQVKWLILVFVVEKFCYGFVWTQWILNNNVTAVFEKDFLAGAFYSIYGINDWLFFVFFLVAFIQAIRMNKSSAY